MVGTARGPAVVAMCAFTGCSFFANAPPHKYKPHDGKPDCGWTTAALIADTTPFVAIAIGAAIGAAYGGTCEPGNNCELGGGMVVAAVTLVSLPWLFSVPVGLNKRFRCSAARRIWNADRDELLQALSARTGATASIAGDTLTLDAVSTPTCMQGEWPTAVADDTKRLSSHGVTRVVCTARGKFVRQLPLERIAR